MPTLHTSPAPKQKYQRLGKIVTQIEMNNPESRKYLKDALDQQIKDKTQKLLSEKA